MRIVPLLFLLAAPAVWAAPFIVSDPYPTTVVQPAACTATEGAKTYQSPVAKNADGSVYCKIDLQGIPPGSHTVQVTATSSVPGVAASTAVPFAFTVGTLAAPASLRLAPQ